MMSVSSGSVISWAFWMPSRTRWCRWGPIGAAGVVCVVDAPALHVQVEASLLFLRKDLDRLRGHLGQRWLTPLIARTVMLVFYMRAFEQPEQVAGRRRIRRVEACLVIDKLGAGAARAHPLGGQVAAILATTHVGTAVFRVDQRVSVEIGTTAAQGHLQAVLDCVRQSMSGGRIFHRAGAGGQPVRFLMRADFAVTLPVTHRRVRVVCGRGAWSAAR